jgi:hypothetical protein
VCVRQKESMCMFKCVKKKIYGGSISEYECLIRKRDCCELCVDRNTASSNQDVNKEATARTT